MHDRLSIKEVGIYAALCALLPKVREAGRLAALLQPHIRTTERPPQKDEILVGKSDLTHADLLLEDRLGSDILMLFKDASFFGEEHASDHISRFIAGDNPYIITLDPINGTLQYGDGLPQYETILTICDRSWKMLGAIIYYPALDEATVAFNQKGESRAYQMQWKGPMMSWKDQQAHIGYVHDLQKVNVPRAFHLGISWAKHEGAFHEAGYTFIDIWSAYTGKSDWTYSQADVLHRKCCAMGWKNDHACLIDAGAFGFVVECAGGVCRRGALNEQTLTYEYIIAANDSTAADLLERFALL